MNILWISDGKKGHEKQVEILLNEISKTENIIIKKEILLVSKLSQLTELVTYSISLLFGNLFLNENKFSAYKDNQIDIVIGAGSSIHLRMLLIKNHLLNSGISVKAISILTPNLYKNRYNIDPNPIQVISSALTHNLLIHAIFVNDNMQLEASLQNIRNRSNTTSYQCNITSYAS